MKNEILKDAMAITAITLAAGLALGIVKDITADPIKEQEIKAKEAAYKAVYTNAESFGQVVLGEKEQEKMDSFLHENGYEVQRIDEIMEAKDSSGESIGYTFTVTTSEGYGGDIQFAMGVQEDGMVKGISILAIGETAGLGMRADTDEFKDQFREKNVDKFVYTKTGARGEEEIDALSGATITTNAMTNGVNAGLCAFQYMKGGDSE